MNNEDKESIKKEVSKQNIKWLIKIIEFDLVNAKNKVEHLNEKVKLLKEELLCITNK